MNAFHIRPAKRDDLPRIYAVRNGVVENLLFESDEVTEVEVLWYLDESIFLVSEDEGGIQGFTCANRQTGYVWALFVLDGEQRRGHGSGLLDAAMALLRTVGHRQAFLTTSVGSKAEGFYQSRGWRAMGVNLKGERVYRLWL